MDEQINAFLASKELTDAIDENLAYNPIPALQDQYILEDLIEEKRQMMEGFSDEEKESASFMTDRYRELFRMHYAFIGIVEPLMTVGKERIEQWRKDVDAYEALFDHRFPLLATVNKNAADKVKNLIPKKFLDLIDDPKRHIISALAFQAGGIDYDGKENRLVPCGTLSFKLVPDDGDMICELEWIYVDPQFREYHYGDALMCEMFHMIKDENVCGVRGVTTPDRFINPSAAKQGTVPAFSMFLDKWKFSGVFANSPEVLLSLKELSGISKNIRQGMEKKEPAPLYDLGDDEFKLAMKKLLQDAYEPDDEFLPYAGKDFYDTDISCFYRDKGGVSGILLARLNQRDELEVVFLKAQTEEVLLALMNYALENALMKYAPTKKVSARVKSDFGAELVEDIFNIAPLLPEIIITMSAPAPEDDMDEEAYEEAVLALSDYEWNPDELFLNE